MRNSIGKMLLRHTSANQEMCNLNSKDDSEPMVSLKRDIQQFRDPLIRSTLFSTHTDFMAFSVRTLLY